MSWWNRIADKARGMYGVPPRPKESAGGCEHPDINLRDGSAEFEWFIARTELETGANLVHGAKHLANLLVYDPGYPEWLELLEQYLKVAGPKPGRLFPRGEKPYFAIEAVRSYTWHRQGRLEDAVHQLRNVVQVRPNTRYLEAWALDWLEPPGTIESLSEPLALQLLGLTLNRFPEAKYSTAARLKQIGRWALLAERAIGSKQQRGVPLTLRAGLLRKAGMFDEARAILKPFIDQKPDWHTATALGLILREEGKIEAAEDSFRQAARLDPDNVGCRLEAGDMYLNLHQWGEAVKWYERALKREQNHPWAWPSVLYCHYRGLNDRRDLDELKDLANEGNQRAKDLCHQLFHGELLEPNDATANMLRRLCKDIRRDPRDAPAGAVRFTVSSLEAPSNALAFRLAMEALDQDVSLTVEVERVPKPDPRKPMAEVKYQLWRYAGTKPIPALPKPSKEVASRIANLARKPYDEPANWAAASHIAAELGPERIEEILAVIVHPPKVPEGTHALVWLPRIQLAAAQVAAQVDGEWEGSVRREALLSVLHGPQDWATEAAIRVMGRLGRDNEAYATDIHDAFHVLADHRPDRGYCSWERTLYTEWLTLPHVWPEERKKLERTLKEIDSE